MLKKIFIWIMGLSLSLNAEQIVSTDVYMLGVNGKNINYRYYMDNTDLYAKVGVGQENLDVYCGDVEYDYALLSIGWSILEIYYKIPMNEEMSSEYISDSVDPYMGVDLVFEWRDTTWTFGYTFGIFQAPKLDYNEYGYIEETDVLGLRMGLRLGFTFGDVDEEVLRLRNQKVTMFAQAFAGSPAIYRYKTQKIQRKTIKSERKKIGYYNQEQKQAYKTKGCSSDIECGYGNSCVKNQFSSMGSCMKSVDSSGMQKFNAPRSNIGINTDSQCDLSIDCPIGFKCVSGNCIQ